MGNSESSRLAQETGLGPTEVERLREKFDMMRHRDAADPKVHRLDEKLFLSKFPSSQQDLALLIFRAMDINSSGFIDFRDFCIVVSVFSHGTVESKIDLAYSLYDSDRKGYIDQQDLKHMVLVFKSSSERILGSLGASAPVTVSGAASTIFTSMKSNGDGTNKVTKEEFHLWCQRNPEIFEQLQTAFVAVKRASYWDWDKDPRPGGVQPSMLPSDCTVM